MAKVKDMIQSKFLRKEDFDEDTIVTIKGVKLEDLGNENANEQRWVLYFEENPKGMVLNITTIRVLEQAYGGDTDDWKSQKVTVYVDPNVSFQGRVVGGLRLRPQKKGAPKIAPKMEHPATPKAKNPAEADFNDDIPW